MTDDTRRTRRTAVELQSTTAKTEPTTDEDRPPTGGQSPNATIDPTDDPGRGPPLDRRHVIAGTLTAFGLSAMGSGQAEDEEENRIRQRVIETLHDYDELVSELDRIEGESDGAITVESAGQSNEGREIFHAKAGKGDTHVVLIGEQHGDEATGCEALLLLFDRLARGGGVFDDLLAELTIHAIPRANPDGVAYGDYRHRYNVDPEAPARREEKGIYTASDGAEIGWDVDRYHWSDWTESPLYEHCPEQYPENPVPEAQILVDTIHEIDPLWVADIHNQYHYVAEGEDGEDRLVTGSLAWPTVDDADPEAQEVAKRLCRSAYDDFPLAHGPITRFPRGDDPGIAYNSYARHGIASVLVAMRGQTNDYGQLSSFELVRSARKIVLNMLRRTADGSLFDVDPDAAEEMPARGDRYEVSLHPDGRDEFLSLLPDHITLPY